MRRKTSYIEVTRRVNESLLKDKGFLIGGDVLSGLINNDEWLNGLSFKTPQVAAEGIQKFRPLVRNLWSSASQGNTL